MKDRTAVIAFISCSPAWYSLDDYDISRPKVSIPTILPNIGNPLREEAEALVWDYLKKVNVAKAFPKDDLFQAYFFQPSDLDIQFRFKDYNEGWNKIPGSIIVEFKNGLRLLFCFNKMVININKGECDCPTDFNREPDLLSRPIL